MDSICRVIVYILAVNIAYLVFSLVKQGFKHYSNYIAELIFVAILSIYLLQIDFSPILACIISAILTIVVVVLPIYFQGQIDALMSEGRYDELKGYASLKASLAWANPNYHLEELANITAEYYETPTVMLEKLRAQLGQGEPYDGMTRVFLGIIHFNNRNFHELINDIRVDGDLDKQSFEELLYLVRAFLETTRYDEAVQAEIALERKVCEDKENIADRMSNVLINRFVFYAFMGWIKEYDLLMESKSEDFKSLPKELKNFWRGVCLFYSGEYALGENLMNNVISNLPEDADVWREFMVKRRNGMIENKEFFNQHVLDKLKDLYTEYNAQIGITIAESEKELSERRKEVQRQERRIQQKEETLDRKIDNIEQKEEKVQKKMKEAEARLAEVETIKKSQFEKLERISGYTVEQAKAYLLEQLEQELSHEKSLKIMGEPHYVRFLVNRDNQKMVMQSYDRISQISFRIRKQMCRRGSRETPF